VRHPVSHANPRGESRLEKRLFDRRRRFHAMAPVDRVPRHSDRHAGIDFRDSRAAMIAVNKLRLAVIAVITIIGVGVPSASEP
jgi:hypothetical protein